MKSATAVRSQIEEKLKNRVTSALTAQIRVVPERIESGLPSLDDLLQGGLPSGVVTEFVGHECSGRTTMALGYVSAVMRAGNVCAWIDVSDAFDPESVAANGVDLERLLWVRCGKERVSVSTAVPPGEDLACGTPSSSAGTTVRGGGSPHPRSEGRDLPQAIGAMLQAHGGLYDRQVRREKKSIGTPGMANRSLEWRSADREEQIATDRLRARRGAIEARCAEPVTKDRVTEFARRRLYGGVEGTRQGGLAVQPEKPWPVLDQALRTADLLLQNGGFSLIVLDLGSTPAEFAWRIPLATWFRFRAACERTRASLLLLTQHPCARSSAELVVRMDTGRMEADSKVMTGVLFQAERERQRSQRDEKLVSIRRPPQSERGKWRASTAWAKGA